MQDLHKLSEELKLLSAQEGLELLAKQFASEITFSTSFGLEDQVITEMIAQKQLNIKIFTLDTGRVFQEIYELADSTKAKYQLPIKTYYPSTEQIEELTSKKGFNSFYQSVENRKECCFIRKVVPLKRALKNNKIWITGLRAEQSENREKMPILEYDENFDIIKFNPLINWTQKDIDNYTEENNIPTSSLRQKGYISIGCSPCTRPIQVGEHPRAGRWWWETSHKECGLHS